MTARFITAWTLALVLLGALSRAGAQGPAPPRFTVESARQALSGCTLVALAPNGALQADEAGTRRTFTRLIELRQAARKLPPLLTKNFICLSNGDWLPLDKQAAAKFAASRLQVWPAPPFAAAADKPLSLFAPNVVLLFWSLPDGVDDPERFFADLQTEPRKRDVVYLKNGDRVEGALSALNGAAGCTVRNDGKKTQIAWSKLAGIAFNTDRQARLKTKKSYARVVLESGARVNVLDLRFEGKSRRWLGKTQFGAAFDSSEAGLLALDVRQDVAVDLADLTPAHYKHRPYLGASWPLAKNAAATGEPLRLFGDTFEKGLGTHAACQVAYKLDGKYERFDAVVGIDEPSRQGRAKVAIALDGKRIDLNDGKELTRHTAPIPVRLDVKNVRTMTLIVEFGSFGDVQANVNWAKARLIKVDAKKRG